MKALEFADVAVVACELLHVETSDLLGVLEVDAVIETLAAAERAATAPEAAAVLLRGVIRFPVLPSGNSRLGVLAASLLCDRNGLNLSLETEATRKLVTAIANDEIDAAATVVWIADRCRPKDATALPPPARAATGEGGRQDEADLVALYLADIARHPKLTKAEEVALAQQIEAGRAAAARLQVLVADPDSDPIEHRRCRREVREGDEAERQLIRANLDLVVRLARSHEGRLVGGRHVALLDIIQEGNLGLLHAVERYDWRRGFAFSTYATWWVRQAIVRALVNRPMRPSSPPPLAPLAPEIDRLLSNLPGELKEALVVHLGLDRAQIRTVDEVSTRLELSVEEAKQRIAEAFRRFEDS